MYIHTHIVHKGAEVHSRVVSSNLWPCEIGTSATQTLIYVITETYIYTYMCIYNERLYMNKSETSFSLCFCMIYMHVCMCVYIYIYIVFIHCM